MLARIAEDRKHVVMPIIDSIDADSFQYYRGGIDILSFSWRLGQTPLNRRRTETEPMPSVSKLYFTSPFAFQPTYLPTYLPTFLTGSALFFPTIICYGSTDVAQRHNLRFQSVLFFFSI